VRKMRADPGTNARQVAIANNCAKPDSLFTPESRIDSPCVPPPHEVIVGQILGHYRLDEQISSGGMGIVYRAHDENLEREVALKVLAPASLRDPVACERFHNEALILSKLNHPNIITVHDFGSQDGIDFLIMEYVPGQTLSARLETGPLTQEEVVHIGEQLAAAVEAAHDRGIIHRDLKPQNVMLTPKGQVKVADFGLAKVFRSVIGTAATRNVTRDFGLVGTIPYMPPEQLRGEPADARSDIYSAGAVLYELATGQRAFPETHGPRLIDSILHDMPPSPSTLTQVSRAFESIVVKCLEKDPRRRYQSAAELGADLWNVSRSTASRQTEIQNHTLMTGCHRCFLRCSCRRLSRFAESHKRSRLSHPRKLSGSPVSPYNS
jgi:serine/threonine protein kinase